MLKKLLTAAFAVAMTFAFTPKANAILITTNADIDITSSNHGGPPISEIEIFSGSGSTGRIFTNQVSGSGPFAVGSSIHTVSAYALAQATDGLQYSGLSIDATHIAIVVGAIQGTVTSNTGGLVTADFTVGGAFVVSVLASTFDSRNPSTWVGDIISTYTLKPPEAVVPGPVDVGAQVAFTAAQTDRSSANIAAAQQSQGVL